MELSNIVLIACAILAIVVVAALLKSKTGAGGKQADPLSEAEVYVAYGRTAQAINLLEHALKENPGRTDIAAKLHQLKQS